MSPFRALPPPARSASVVCGLFLAFLVGTTASLAAAPTVTFDEARRLAASTGKLILVDFTATWCAPCRLMDETALADPGVLAYLAKHYVSLKADIDDLDGLSLKQRFDVRTVPTLLVLASDGSEVDRIVGSVGTTELLKRLKSNDVPRNRRVVSREPATRVWSRPLVRLTNALPPPRGGSGRVDTASARVVDAATGVFRLQAGAFSDRANAVREADLLRELTDHPVEIAYARGRGAEVYRVIVGYFRNRDTAAALATELEAAGIIAVPHSVRLR